jgi:hypothetical protein
MNEKIEQLLNSLKELYNLGISMNQDDSEISEILKSMYILEKKTSIEVENEDILLYLIDNYDISQFDIGGITFYNTDDFSYDDVYTYIGSDGAGDYIAINKKDGAIYNIIDNNAIEIKIASSGENFLNNLIEIGKYNFSNTYSVDRLNEILNKISFNNESRKFYFPLLRSI